MNSLPKKTKFTIVETKVWNDQTYHKNQFGRWFRIRNRDKRGTVSYHYYIETICNECGLFALRDVRSKNRNTYCSRKCVVASASGDKNHGWAGGRRLDCEGYMILCNRIHPNNKNGIVREHRIVVEESLGRYLDRSEVVHHIDCDKQNNSIENLVVMSNGEHGSAHRSLEDCVKDLMKLGVLRFNKITLKYEVKADNV